MDNEISILIADDHYLIAKLVRMMLLSADEKYKVSTVDNGKEVLSYIKSDKIDILILDIDMPELDGIAVLKTIKISNPEIKVLMVSNHTQTWIINRALKFGANGYICKYADSDEILKGIKSIMKNEIYLCHTTLNCLQPIIRSDPNDPDNIEFIQNQNKLGKLSKREVEILKLIVDESSSKEISELLTISIRTVETHRKNILKKLGVKNTLGLIRLFVESDLLKSIEDEFHENIN